jgi:hypothetical protein
MRNRVFAAALLLCAAIHPAVGAESEFQITPRIGQGELQIDAFEAADEEFKETDVYGIGVGFGVLTPIGVVLEIGGESQGRFELFDEDDDFSLSTRYIALGYQVELGDGWSIVPKVSRVRWKLRSDDGLFDFDDSEDDQQLRGYEFMYEATVARKVSRVLTLGLNYKQGNFEFGKAREVSFLVQFGI